MLSYSGDNLAISYDLDPLSDDVLLTLARHLYVHSPSISLKCWWHVNISPSCLKAVYFSLLLLDNAIEWIDVATTFFEVLLGDSSSVAYSGDKSICDGTCSDPKVIVLIHVEDSFCHARQDWWVWGVGVRVDGKFVDADVEGCWWGNFLYRWSGGRWDMLSQHYR